MPRGFFCPLGSHRHFLSCLLEVPARFLLHLGTYSPLHLFWPRFPGNQNGTEQQLAKYCQVPPPSSFVHVYGVPTRPLHQDKPSPGQARSSQCRRIRPSRPIPSTHHHITPDCAAAPTSFGGSSCLLPFDSLPDCRTPFLWLALFAHNSRACVTLKLLDCRVSGSLVAVD